MPVDDEMRVRLENLIERANSQRNFPKLPLDILVVEPFASDVPEGSIGVQLRYDGPPERYESGRWSRLLDDVEKAFASAALEIDLAHSKRREVDGFTSATWVLFPQRPLDRRR